MEFNPYTCFYSFRVDPSTLIMKLERILVNCFSFLFFCKLFTKMLLNQASLLLFMNAEQQDT